MVRNACQCVTKRKTEAARNESCEREKERDWYYNKYWKEWLNNNNNYNINKALNESNPFLLATWKNIQIREYIRCWLNLTTLALLSVLRIHYLLVFFRARHMHDNISLYRMWSTRLVKQWMGCDPMIDMENLKHAIANM